MAMGPEYEQKVNEIFAEHDTNITKLFHNLSNEILVEKREVDVIIGELQEMKLAIRQ